MRSKKLSFKKEIVANLSNTESNQIRGGKETDGPFNPMCVSLSGGMCCSYYGCPSNVPDSCLVCNYTFDNHTSCYGDTYCNCTKGGC